jgi:hypothetical protein
VRALLAIFLVFAVPLAIAYLLGYWNDRSKAKEKMEREWRTKLRAKERDLGRRLTVEEIQQWLIYEWFKDRVRNAEDFARKIKFDLIERR